MSAKDGIAEPGSLLDEINQFGALIGKPPIRMKPITTGVAKVHIKRKLLAQIEAPINYAGVHWIVIDVYGELSKDENGKSILGDMHCYVNDEPADWIPESLQQVIANEILSGDHD